MSKQIVDGCTAAAHAAYAFSEVATIYPITPIASMGETAGKWALEGRKNLFGSTMDIREMESELGAAGATHGALAAGGFATTFTSSQGLLLMIPNMYKIAGELLPAVFHVGSRSIAAQALSIFGDHQDVMACRGTGFTMLASASVQEALDLGVVAHIAAINGSLPVLHFFDGWRTSNEMNTIDVVDYEKLRPLLNHDKVEAFRQAALNPEHPWLRGSAQNPDVYFQNREAANKYYDAFPAIMQKAMDDYAAITGRAYHLFEYVGAPDATDVIISMASSTQVVAEAVEALNASGRKVGLVNVRLYRPFKAEALLEAIPQSVERIAVLDRCKDPGALGEPLYLDVAAAVQASGRSIKVIGGRYGLGSKEFDPAMAKGVFDMLATAPRHGFTVGINDDVTHTSIIYNEDDNPSLSFDVTQCYFYGIGADGTVGATRQAASILVDVAGLYAQAYFKYSAKKSGGYTVSQLRFSPTPISNEYSIKEADYVGCNRDKYVYRFDLTGRLKKGGVFVLNSAWTDDELSSKLPAPLRRDIATKQIKFYNIDAGAIAREVGLGVRINTIMEVVFLSLAPGVDFDAAYSRLKEIVTTQYRHEGNAVVQQNLDAMSKALQALRKVVYPTEWANATDAPAPAKNIPEFVAKVAVPCNRLEGDKLPVSLMNPAGFMPPGTTAYEKRGIAVNIPTWDSQKCIQCTQCSLVCPHASIRPVLLDAQEVAAAPADFVSVSAHAPALKGLNYRIQVYPLDCTGCGSCAVICPGHALTMVPVESQLPLQANMLEYAQTKIVHKDTSLPATTLNGSQFRTPYLEFSGACAGCGETPYVKLLTQLFGSRMLIANATGCSSIWGANFPSNAYCTDASGRGPAWGNSLFEDNAEYGFGMLVALNNRREALLNAAKTLSADATVPSAVVDALKAWIDAFSDPDKSQSAGNVLAQVIKAVPSDNRLTPFVEQADILGAKTVWAIGGDGWAYDIGFAGLDHVLAQNDNIKILVMDTECYSNTGGQTSKATPLSAVTKYSLDGKRTVKKDLGRMMMTYGNVYVASVALGANYMQTIRALAEAEAYPGPAIVIAYCPCIAHGIRTGMSHTIVEEKLAVKSGYWPLYRYNPLLAQQGKNPLEVDAPAPDGSLITYINNEDRYADLNMIDPAEASILQPKLQQRAEKIYQILSAQAQITFTPKAGPNT